MYLIPVQQLCLPHYLHLKVVIAACEREINVLTKKSMDVDLVKHEKSGVKSDRKRCTVRRNYLMPIQF
jgi:hypothetical protein